MEHRQAALIDVYADTDRVGGPVVTLLEECRLGYRLLALRSADTGGAIPGFPALPTDALGVAIVDHDTGVHVFRQGAALEYLAEKTGRFLPADPDGRFAVLQWLHWNAEYRGDSAASLGCLEAALTGSAYLAGEYAVADMAVWWRVHADEGRAQRWPEAVRHWYEAIRHRPAVHHARMALDAAHTDRA